MHVHDQATIVRAPSQHASVAQNASMASSKNQVALHKTIASAPCVPTSRRYTPSTRENTTMLS